MCLYVSETHSKLSQCKTILCIRTGNSTTLYYAIAKELQISKFTVTNVLNNFRERITIHRYPSSSLCVAQKRSDTYKLLSKIRIKSVGDVAKEKELHNLIYRKAKNGTS